MLPKRPMMGIDDSLTSTHDFNLDQFPGATYRGKPVATLNQVIDHIDAGPELKASNGVITYTFLTLDHLVGMYNNKNFGFTAGFGLSSYSSAQQDAARASVQLWDDLIPQSFKEVNGLGADIVFANSLDPAQAYAYYPGHQGWKFQSDVFTADPNNAAAGNWTNKWFSYGGYGTTTLVHELGHTLGLSHPGAYNYDPNLDLTYANYAEYAQDSMQYTIMSYWGSNNTGARTINWSSFLNDYPQTPLVHDILTIQSKYGADPTTRAGDTIYGFHANAGNDVFDFTHNPFPYLAVYDAAGHDTIDLSGFTVSQFIDLHPGSFSSIGGAIPTLAAINATRAELTTLSGETFAPVSQAQVNATGASFMNANANSIAADTGVTGIKTTEYQNFAIAYGTHIEDAIGGSARDLIFGNDDANRLYGMAGDDVLRGFGGDDLLVGGLGKDTLTGGAGHDTFLFDKAEIGDLITDLTQDDRIDLSGLGNNLHYIASSGFTGHAGEVNYINGTLSADLNGDSVADFAVVLQGAPSLQPDQLVLHI
ncbi:hypothetical protein HMF7854_02915 [Sphingomonas ginkgonis]|uniref:Peptidase metallopeptidase domain-containing protein n=1 Tax=Sphingomonas ginkgonis TaxID=2315330 RepID=A0A3R9WR90_9SPHN|nr:M10 family metallopeptidase C-terminal domain-containing protein [Sphingomonas ginkgonis]RST29889.1 hypothetical protein HMF7854_02915 [Sphingomonas ginkgonis]